MKNTSESQMTGLKNYAEQRSQTIIAKANQAIDELVQNGEAITFEAVAKAAGVARGTLYNYSGIKERILELKQETHMNPTVEDAPVRKTKVQRLEERIAVLSVRITQLEDDKRKLIIQLVDMEELKEENERLRSSLKGGHL